MSDSVSSLKSQIEKLRKNVDSSELRITQLEREKLEITKSNESLNQEITNLRKTNTTLTTDLTKALGNADISLVQRNSQLEVDLKKSDLEKQELTKQLNALQRDNIAYQNDNKLLIEKFDAISANLTKVQDTIGTSFSAEDLSAYLNKAIDDFNKNSSTEDSYAKYVISSMDVDLKTQIFYDEKKNLRFSAPNLEKTTENSLSSIKISIRAIPKQ